jgi:hypothetical protein
MAEDDDGQRWELTVRGLKQQRRRLQFPGTVAAVVGVDSRQGGGGALDVLLVRKKGRGEKNLGRRRPAPFNCGGGGGGWRGARATLSVGSDPTPVGVSKWA